MGKANSWSVDRLHVASLYLKKRHNERLAEAGTADTASEPAPAVVTDAPFLLSQAADGVIGNADEGEGGIHAPYSSPLFFQSHAGKGMPPGIGSGSGSVSEARALVSESDSVAADKGEPLQASEPGVRDREQEQCPIQKNIGTTECDVSPHSESGVSVAVNIDDGSQPPHFDLEGTGFAATGCGSRNS